jgi:uncharacterized membrane protein
MKNTKLLASAVVLASMQLAMPAHAAKDADPSGKCYGVVGKGEGECGGKNPANGESWSCAGHNPTADLGWKKMKKSDCVKAEKHKEATAKKFEVKKGQIETL